MCNRSDQLQLDREYGHLFGQQLQHSPFEPVNETVFGPIFPWKTTEKIKKSERKAPPMPGIRRVNVENDELEQQEQSERDMRWMKAYNELQNNYAKMVKRVEDAELLYNIAKNTAVRVENELKKAKEKIVDMGERVKEAEGMHEHEQHVNVKLKHNNEWLMKELTEAHNKLESYEHGNQQVEVTEAEQVETIEPEKETTKAQRKRHKKKK
jgi:hypothetical protein